MVQNAPLRFPTSSADPSVFGPSTGGAAVGDSDSPTAHGPVLVSMPAAAAVGPPMGTPVARGRSLPGRRSDQELPADRPVSVGLAPENERIERPGASQDVVRAMQSARAASTRTSYTDKWTAFQLCCAEKSLKPTTCPLPPVLSILQLLVEKNLAFSTVKNYAAAVSSCHEGLGDRSVFSHPLMKLFLRGAQRHRMVTRSLASQWDLAFFLA